MKIVIQIILLLAIIVLGYLLLASVAEPIQYQKEKEKRYEATIKRLIDIRTAEVAYKSVHKKYTGSFDTLINFIKKDSLRIVKAIGNVPDTLTERQAVEMGLVRRDTILVSTLDSLFPAPYPIDSLRFVPFSNGKYQFKLAAGLLETGSKVTVKVFQASVLNRYLLHGMSEQDRINDDDEAIALGKFPGLRVGSMKEATNNAGNWE